MFPPFGGNTAHTHIHTYIHTSIHTYIHISTHTYIHTYICTYIYPQIHTYIDTFENNSEVEFFNSVQYDGFRLESTFCYSTCKAMVYFSCIHEVNTPLIT